MLHTRLYAPPITPDQVIRSSLIDDLNSHMHMPLTMVVAPAGYGKSVLVSQWLHTLSITSSWLSIDESLDDFHLFIEHLVLAINKINPGQMSTLLDLIRAPETVPIDRIIEELVNKLDEIEDEFILVLDDYHSISNDSIHKLVRELIRFMPQTMHLVVVTRRDPPLNLYELKLYNRLHEIRMNELSFSKDEIIQLFEGHGKVKLSTKELDVLFERTEGWVLGLRMMALLQLNTSNHSLFYEHLKGGVPLADFLIRENVYKQTEQIQQWLFISSLFKSFCPSLIQHVAEEVSSISFIEDSQSILEQVLAQDLFVLPLNDSREWFRYHHLFQDILKKEASILFTQSQLNEMHLAAHNWFAENDMLDQALAEAHQCGNDELVVNFILKYRLVFMAEEQWNRLNNWMNSIGDDVIKSHPLLRTTQLFLLDYSGHLSSLLVQSEALQNDLKSLTLPIDYRELFEGEYHTLLGEVKYIQGDTATSAKHSSEAFKLLPRNAEYPLIFANYWRSFSLQALGKSEKATEFLREAIDKPFEFSRNAIPRLQIALSGVHMMSGNLQQSLFWSIKCYENAERYKLNESISLAYSFSAKLYYWRDERKLGRQMFEKLWDLRYVSRAVHVLIESHAHISAFLNDDDYTAAEEFLIELKHFIAELNQPYINEILILLEMDLNIRTRSWDSFRVLKSRFNYDFMFPPAWFSFYPMLTPAKVVLYDPDDPQPEKSLQRILPLVEYGETMHNKGFCIAAYALKSIIHDKLNQKQEAYHCLNHALDLAEGGRYIKQFLDLALDMEALLKSFLKRESHSYGAEVLQHFKSISERPFNSPNNRQHIQLTSREMEILSAVSKGFRNKEVASQFFISTETVKRHLSNIFQKMGVHNRVALIRKARNLDLLDSSES